MEEENKIVINNENFTTTIDNDSITITKNEVTLKDLKSNLVKYLNQRIGKLEFFKSEIELLDVILRNEKVFNFNDLNIVLDDDVVGKFIDKAVKE